MDFLYSTIHNIFMRIGYLVKAIQYGYSNGKEMSTTWRQYHGKV